MTERTSRAGRKLEFPEKMVAALPPGTFDRMAAVAPEEDRTAFIRAAVEAELRRREGGKRA